MTAYAAHQFQPQLPVFSDLSEAVEVLASAGIEERGAIYTRPEVVEFILDLVGYTTDKPLHRERLLEPSFGGGDFLFGAVERLLTAYKARPGTNIVEDLAPAIRAVELHRATFTSTARKLTELLERRGVSANDADALAKAWLTRDDFLLTEIEGTFDYVVGNPPYVRQS